jgi:hypothetical protein
LLLCRALRSAKNRQNFADSTQNKDYGCEAGLRFADLNGVPFDVVNPHENMTFVANGKDLF